LPWSQVHPLEPLPTGTEQLSEAKREREKALHAGSDEDLPVSSQGEGDTNDLPWPKWYEDSFGGQFLSDKRNSQGERIVRFKRSSAYMLVYVREDALPDALGALDANPAPDHLRLRHEADVAHAAQRKKEEAEAHLYLLVQLVIPLYLEQGSGLELLGWKDVQSHKVHKDTNCREWLQQQEGVPEQFCFYNAEGKYYPGVHRHQTGRLGLQPSTQPALVLAREPDAGDYTFDDPFWQRTDGRIGATGVRIVVLPAPTEPMHGPAPLWPVFLKEIPQDYLAHKEGYSGKDPPVCVTSLEWVPYNRPVTETSLGPRLAAGAELCVRNSEYKTLSLSHAVNSERVKEREPPSLEEFGALAGQVIYVITNMDDDGDNPLHWHWSTLSATVRCYDKPEVTFEVELTRSGSYQDCCYAIAAQAEQLELGELNPNKLLLYERGMWSQEDRPSDDPIIEDDKFEFDTWEVSHAISSRQQQKLRGLLLFYKSIPITVEEWQNSTPLTVEYQTAKGTVLRPLGEEGETTMFVPAKSLVGNAVEQFKAEHVKGSEDSSRGMIVPPGEEAGPARTRCFTISKKSGYVDKPMVPPSATVEVIGASSTLVIEEISDEERELMSLLPAGANAKYKSACHVWQKEEDGDLYDHGRSFAYLVLKEDTLQDIEDRLKRRFGMPLEEESEWSVVVMKFPGMALVESHPDDNALEKHFAQAQLGMRLGLKHRGEQRKSKRPKTIDRFFSGGGGLKIRG